MIPVAILTGILIAVILYAMLTNNNVNPDDTIKPVTSQGTSNTYSLTPPLPSPAPVYLASPSPAPGTFTGTAPVPAPAPAPAPAPVPATTPAPPTEPEVPIYETPIV